ncbi:unnamed protein product, partial [Pylaiella littoralis]
MSPGLMGGGSDGGAILAAMDLGGAPGLAPAGLLGLIPAASSNANHGDSGSSGMHVQLHALGKIHEKKVRTLMRSVAELKKRLALATAQGKDHRRSAMIRAMRTRLREQELVVDVIKEELGIKAEMGKEEINDWVIRKTVGGPLRFRPKTREELQNELYRLEKKHRVALDRLKARSRTGRDVGAGAGPETQDDRPKACERGGDHHHRHHHHHQASTKELMRLSEALEEVDALRVSIRSREAALLAQAEAVDQLQLENRELRGLQERLGRKERRARDLKKKNASLGEQHTALLEDYEACQEQASCIHHLKAQLALSKEEARAEADEFREQSLRQAEEMGVLLKREEELTNAVEEEVASRQRERREHHHTGRQARKTAEKALQAAEKQGRRLRDQNESMTIELQRLGREAAEAAGLRERGREMALEIKRLVKEAEARQGRLEEARDRGTTLAEALRASKESLEAERLSKEALSREAGETKALLVEGKALLEAEAKRANDEGEARRRLESMLAAEMKKEEDMGVAAAATAAEAAARIAAANAAAAAAAAAAAVAAAAARPARPAQVPGEAEKEQKERVEAMRAQDLAESDEIIEEMESELREQAEQIIRLEEEKQASERHLDAATKVSDELREINYALKAQLRAAAAVTAAAPSAALEADAGATSSRTDDAKPPLLSPRRNLRPSTSAEEKERKLREDLAASKAAEKSAIDACLRLKLEVDDAKASCELQKGRVKDLVANRVSPSVDD